MFRRDGDDLEVVVKIPMTAAALGTEVMVATLEADLEDSAPESRAVRIAVPAGTQSGTRIADGRQGRAAVAGQRARSARSHLCSSRLRRGSTTSSGTCYAQLAELRDETRPEVTVQKHGRGVFGRLRDAFAGQ